MVGESYNRAPEGRIVVRGEPHIQVEKKLTEAAKAGMLVTCDSNDYKIKKLAANTMPIGWLSFEYTDAKTRPADFETAYASGDIVTVIAGGNFDIYAIATGEASTGNDVTINAGDYLASNGDGTLKVYSPNGTVSSSTATNPYPPIAVALETITIPKASGATPDTKRIVVKSLI